MNLFFPLECFQLQNYRNLSLDASLLPFTLKQSNDCQYQHTYEVLLHIIHPLFYLAKFYFFYSIINHKHILKKFYKDQEDTHRYLENYENTMFEQKLIEKVT